MAVFDLHHPWAFAFGILGNIVSILVYFAPLPTFIRIYKEKSTMGFDSTPYVVALFSAMLWMYYALLKTKDAYLLISINSFGCFIEIIYIFFYLFYASKKAKTRALKMLGLMDVGLYSAIFLFTYFKFEGNERIQIVGWICVVVSVSVFAAPLSIMFQVIRTRSVEFMPFPLSFFLTLSAVVWFGYGLFKHDICVAVPNVLGFALGIIQMVLYAIFRNSKTQKIEEEKLPEQVINVMVLETPAEPEKCENKIEEIIKDEESKNEKGSIVPCAMNVEPSRVNVQLEAPPIVVVCVA